MNLKTVHCSRNPLLFRLQNPLMVSLNAFCQSAAHTQAFYSNCMLLDSCPGHTGGPYGKQENVSLKFNYLPLCIDYVLLLHLSGVLQTSRCQCPFFPNSPATAPLTWKSSATDEMCSRRKCRHMLSRL